MEKTNKKRKFSNLFKKLKKTGNLLRILFFITFLIYLVSVGLVIYNIGLLDNIENLFRIIVIIILIVYFLVFLIFGMALLITKKKGWLITWMILTLIFSAVNGFVFYYVNKTYNIVDTIVKEKVIYTTDLVALSKDTQIKTVGLLKNEKSVEGNILAQEYIAINNKKYKIVYYDDNISLIHALYDKKVDGIFITSNYILQYSSDDAFPNIANETVVIDKYSKKMDNQDTVKSTNKDVTEPFTVLLLGVDSEYDGLANNAAFNGDTIMLVTFNPKTLSATVFSIPRDTYVPIACNNNRSNKINSAAAYGTNCMINTIQKLTGVTIDYFVKVNFKGVVSLVESLGGINVDVDEPDYDHNGSIYCGAKTVCEQNSNREFGKSTVYIKPGKNVHLNGEQALAYSRDRHQWAASDFVRITHQQAVVTAIINKAKTIKNINTFYKVLNAVSNNIDTNMSTSQMLNFYNVGKNVLTSNNFSDGEFINVQKTYLSGYDLHVYINGIDAYTFQYYQESLDEITNAIKINLGITSPKIIRTFNFSVNEPYVVPTIGTSYTAVKRNETLPNFVGSSLSYVQSWASTRNITINPNYVNDSTCVDNAVLSQDVHYGLIVSSISTLNVNVCKNQTTNTNNSNIKENNETTTKTETTTKETTTETTTTTTEKANP